MTVHFDASGIPLAVGDQVEIWWERSTTRDPNYQLTTTRYIQRITATVLSLGKRVVTVRPHDGIFHRNVKGKSLWLVAFGHGRSRSTCGPSMAAIDESNGGIQKAHSPVTGASDGGDGP